MDGVAIRLDGDIVDALGREIRRPDEDLDLMILELTRKRDFDDDLSPHIREGIAAAQADVRAGRTRTTAQLGGEEDGAAWSARAAGQLGRAGARDAAAVRAAVSAAAADPFSAVQRLSGSGQFRMRAGDYRIISDIEGGMLVVLLVEREPRDS